MKLNRIQRYYLTNDFEDNYWLNVAATVVNEFPTLLKEAAVGQRPSLYAQHEHYIAKFSVAKLRVFTWFEGSTQGFWLIQHHKNLAIFIPSDNVYVSLYAHDNDLHKIVVDELAEILKSSKSQKNESSLNKDAYLYASYSRPYHYFYDVLPPLLKIAEDNEADHKIGVITHLNGSFFPLGSFSNINEVNYSTCDEMNGALKSNQVVALKATKDNFLQSDVSTYDDSIISQACSIVKDKPLTFEIDELDFALWFGACSEKRSWVEWEEALIACVDYILEQVPTRRIIVLVDGMTSPVYTNRKAYLKTLRSSALYNIRPLSMKLKRKGVFCYNLAGLKAHQKIYLAQKVDFFVSGFLTDSIYVSRFGKVEGIGHGATVANPGQHHNPRCYFIPKTYVRDIPGDDNWAKISYSISIDNFVNFFSYIFHRRDKHFFISENDKVKVLSKLSNSRTTVLDSFSDKVEYVSLRPLDCMESDEGFNVIDKMGKELKFRSEGKSLRGSRCFVIGYDENGKKCLSKGISFGVTATINFSNDVKKFEIKLRILGGDRVWLHDVHWTSFGYTSSVRLGNTT